jgi:hypothetical protein
LPQLRLEFSQTAFGLDSLLAFRFRLPLSLVLQTLCLVLALLRFNSESLGFTA